MIRNRCTASRRWLVVGFVFALITITRSVAAAVLSAGVARIDLTPPLKLKAPLGGYGARMSRPAEGVHDRIFAKALVVSDGQRKFVLVTADLLGFAPAFKVDLIARLKDKGWTDEQVMLLPSHSHTSIDMNALNPQNVLNIPQIGIHNPAVYELTLKNFVELIGKAGENLQPVTIGTTSRRIAGWNRNRREKGGVTDDELTITRIDTTAGKPLAALVNFTAHPTFMSEREMLFSGDWPGALQRAMETAIGDGVTAMYFNGAQGDQSPVARPDSGDSPWEKVERYGFALGIVATDQWRNTKTSRDVKFGYHLQPVNLPPRAWHPDFMQTGGKEYGLNETFMAELLKKVTPDTAVSGSVRLGDLVIIGIPGEAAAGLGLRIKSEVRAATGAEHAVIGGLCNEWISYILTAESYLKGSGYEASMSFYGPELGDRVMKAAVEGASTLK